jgi:hypothetical protein
VKRSRTPKTFDEVFDTLLEKLRSLEADPDSARRIAGG